MNELQQTNHLPDRGQHCRLVSTGPAVNSLFARSNHEEGERWIGIAIINDYQFHIITSAIIYPALYKTIQPAFNSETNKINSK